MILKCLGSGSSGNCYLLDGENETLVLDCGLPIKQIKKGLNWDISKVVGVCATHRHLDHLKAADDFWNMGINVCMPWDSFIFTNGEYAERLHVNYGNFDINAFALTDTSGKFMHTNNDGSECPCYGFLIEHPDMGKMLYITDTELVKWRFIGINHILISCNYDKDLIPQDHPAREHIFRGHMELQTVKEFIKANKSNTLRTVILCHLSQENADPDKMLAEVQQTAGAGVKCVVAVAGETVELSQYPF